MKIIPEHQLPDVQKYVKSMAEGMDGSAICLTLLTENFERGVDSLLQFAICCMLDKPLFLLVPEGRKIPESVRKIAVAIETFNPNDQASLHLATTKLLSMAQSKGFTA